MEVEIIEYYCLNKNCFYHGPRARCPECGKQTKPVRKNTFTPPKPDHDVYTLREISGPPMGGRRIKGVKKLGFKEIDTSDDIPEKDVLWNIPAPHHIVWKNSKKLSIYQGVKI